MNRENAFDEYLTDPASLCHGMAWYPIRLDFTGQAPGYKTMNKRPAQFYYLILAVYLSIYLSIYLSHGLLPPAPAPPLSST